MDIIDGVEQGGDGVYVSKGVEGGNKRCMGDY